MPDGKATSEVYCEAAILEPRLRSPTAALNPAHLPGNTACHSPCCSGKAAYAVKVSVHAVGQHLRQAGVDVKRVSCGDAVDGLLELVTPAIVGERAHG